MDIKNDILTFLKRKKKDKTDDSVSTVSFNEGDTGKIFGINRKIVIAMGIVCMTTFAIAFIFATDSSEQASQTAQHKREEKAATNKGPNDAMRNGNTYEQMMKDANRQATGNGNNSNNRQQNNSGNRQTNGNNSQVNAPQRTGNLPQVPQNQYPAGYPMQNPAYAGVVPNIQAPAVNTEDQDNNQAYKAPIAFGLGNSNATDSVKGEGSASSNTGNGNVGAMSGMNYATYSAPNEMALLPGTVIPAILCTGINSDVDGQVVAMVEQDIYDTASGNNLLIPAGSRVLGTYKASASAGSGRVGLEFTSIVLPDGSALSLSSNALSAVDGAGYSGVAGSVNNHTEKQLSSGILSSAIAALGSVAAGNTSNTSNTYSGGQLAMQGAMANVLNAASSIFTKSMNVQPTVTVDPGYQFNIFVTQPLIFN